MEYARFGNTGIRVSRLCVGCMDFPNKLDESESRRIVHTALDNGVNFIDTADSYGASEEVLGRVLKGRRDQVVLATKVHLPGGGANSRSHMIHALETSLRRLQTDYVDLYQLHHPDPATTVEETLSTLDNMMKKGKIRYIGASNHYAWQMAHMLGVSALHSWEPISSAQFRYNIMDRAIENEIAPFVGRFNIATMTYGPLNWGILSGNIRRGESPPEGSRLASMKHYSEHLMTEDVFDVLDELHDIAEMYDIGVNQLAFTWLLSKPHVTSVVMGGSKPHHFDSIYDVCEIKIEPADLEKIDNISEKWRYAPFHNQPIVLGYPVACNR